MRTARGSVLVVSMLAFGCAESGGERTTSSMNPSNTPADDGTASDDGTSPAGDDGTGPSDDGTTPSDGEDADADSGVGVNLPDASGGDTCTGEATEAQLPTYAGAQPTFTREDLKACQTTCQGKGGGCFVDANCPGIEAWNDCALTNVLACVGSEGKSCRRELELVDCCVAAADCADDDVSCVQIACRAEIEAFQTCQNADAACNADAPVSCFAPSN